MRVLFQFFLTVNIIAAQAGPGLVIVLPGENVELLCNIAGGVPVWMIDGGTGFSPNQLFMGDLPGHNISLDGRNIIVEDIVINDSRNGSNYTCFVPQGLGTPDIQSDPTTLLVAGKIMN